MTGAMENIEDMPSASNATCPYQKKSTVSWSSKQPAVSADAMSSNQGIFCTESHLMGSQVSQDSSTAVTPEHIPCRGIRTCWQENNHPKEKKPHQRDGSKKDSNGSVPPGGEPSTEDSGGEGAVRVRKSRSTVTRGLLSTSGFVWVPLCQPSTNSRNCSSGIPTEVQNCPRLYMRRNALADPMQMALPQGTRERIEKEVEERKSSFTRKVSQYFKAIYSDDYEVDLI